MMKLEELLRDETVRRHEFPVCEQKIFLAHAGVSPLPRRVSEAMREYLDSAARDNQEDVLPERIVSETRQLAARLIEARAEEIAFVGSTSMGLAMVAAGLPWERGDNVVCYRDDYPANVYPWMNLASRGVEVRFVEPQQYGNITVDDLERVLNKRTRLVSLASVHFVSGWRLDVDRIGQFLHERGVLFCLDGIQSFGALRTSMQHVDFAAADAHKWLLGPLGVAILFVRREHFETMRPPLVGWHSASCPDYVAQDKLAFWPDARRYEPGSLNLVGLVGLHAALRLIVELGITDVETRVLELARKTIEEGARNGLRVAGAMVDEAGLSGIVSFVSDERDVAQLHAKLAEASLVTSLRRRRDGVRCLRLSPHFYNSFTELNEWSRRL
ncbi:MAG TPA: aminotransferase class V-fold PLP-dependent enzyme [Verrucomicrobiae bacterium]|nr:aminotransferase class V-fold PLP-dependent enzyme [Verrucomicrobiae bacterium]